MNVNKLLSLSRKRSFLAVTSVCFLCLYISWSVGAYIHQELVQNFAQDVNRKFRHTLQLLQIGQTLLAENQHSLLNDYLTEAESINDIDFFYLRYQGKTIGYGGRKGGLNDLKINYTYYDTKVLLPDDKGFYYVRKVNDYELVIGVVTTKAEFLKTVLRRSASIIVRDLIVVAFLLITILFYFHRDILAILRTFQNKRERKYQEVEAKTADSALLMRGLNTYEKSVEDLSGENQVLRNQVLPALRSEIMSGRKPPYDFMCTLVRMDINNFSHIFSNYPLEPFMQYIDRFFEEATHIVSRYGGYIYEFVGDEVIFYFKDEDHANSTTIALSAIRDINQSATRLNKETQTQAGYPFVVKSSLAHGRIRFGKQVDGYSLAGSILIETVRILSHIHEKDENVVFYDENIAERVRPLIRSKKEQTVQLKGIAELKTLYSYVEHEPLTEIIADIESRRSIGRVGDLTYYRNDHDLALVLRHLNYSIESLNRDLYLAITKVLKGFQVTKTGEETKREYQSLLNSVTEQLKLHPSDKYMFYLSSLLITGIHLIGKDAYDDKFAEHLKTYINYDDRRVVANILDVFSYFDASHEDLRFQNLLKHQDNRIMANAIIKEGKKELSKVVIRKLKEMLSSKSERFVASGLYSLGEVSMYHSQANPIYFETNTGVNELLQLIPGFFSHPSEMVRRQCYIAVRKCGVERLRQELLNFYNSTSPALRTEVDIYYLKPKSQAS